MLFGGEHIYIGNYTQYEAQSYNRVHIAKTPTSILALLKSTPIKKHDTIVLSTGISNGCASYNVVNQQIEYIASLNVKFIVLKDNSCMGSDSVLRIKCNEFKRCTYKKWLG